VHTSWPRRVRIEQKDPINTTLVYTNHSQSCGNHHKKVTVNKHHGKNILCRLCSSSCHSLLKFGRGRTNCSYKTMSLHTILWLVKQQVIILSHPPYAPYDLLFYPCLKEKLRGVDFSQQRRSLPQGKLYRNLLQVSFSSVSRSYA
jgi:hypothetical protein